MGVKLPPLGAGIVRNRVGVKPLPEEATAVEPDEAAGENERWWKPGEIEFDAEQLEKFEQLHIVDGDESDEEMALPRFSDNVAALKMIHEAVEKKLGMTTSAIASVKPGHFTAAKDKNEQERGETLLAAASAHDFDELAGSDYEEVDDEDPEQNFANRVLKQGRSFLGSSGQSFKSFISQREQEARKSKKVTEELLNQAEGDFYMEIFKKNWAGGHGDDGRRTTLRPVENFRQMKLIDLGRCQSENDQDHRAKRTMQTLKYGEDYFVITKQFLHRQMLTEHSNLLMQVAKLSNHSHSNQETEGASARFELQHSRNIAVGDYNSPDLTMTKTKSQFVPFAAKLRCIDPSFISFVQRGHYIYFFIIGKDADVKAMKDFSVAGGNGSQPMSFSEDEQHEGGKKEKGKKEVEIEEDEEDEEEEEEEEDDEEAEEEEEESEDDKEEVSAEEDGTGDEQEDDSEEDGASEEAASEEESDENIEKESNSEAASKVDKRAAAKPEPRPDASEVDKATTEQNDHAELRGGMKDLATGEDDKTAMSKSFFTKRESLKAAPEGGHQRDYSSQQSVGAPEDASEMLHVGKVEAQQSLSSAYGMDASLGIPSQPGKTEVTTQGIMAETESFKRKQEELAEKEAAIEQEHKRLEEQERLRVEAEQARQEEIARKAAEAEEERRRQEEEQAKQVEADRQRQELEEQQRKKEERA